MAVIYLALGTNLGDRADNLQAALQALEGILRVTARSSIYETPPWGYTDQPAFLNMVLRGETRLAPQALLQALKETETALGRQPSFRYGPRRIDLDILFYDDLILESEALTIPHPRLHQRAFVLVPLNEIAPHLIHPVLRRSVQDLLQETGQEGIVRWQAGI